MKKISILIIACLALVCFNACEKNEDPIFVASAKGNPKITTPNATVTLTQETAKEQAITIVWDDAKYSVSTPITYTIEASPASAGFSKPEVVGKTKERFYTWTVGELNALAIKLGLTTSVEGSLEIRVKSSIGSDDGVEAISNITIVTLTPYPTIIPMKNLFFVGNAVDTNKDGVADDADWNNNAKNTYLFRDGKNDNEFHFQGFFDAKDFKLLEVKGEWQPQWGLDSGALTNSEILGGDPDTFAVTSAGFYSLKINIKDLTYSLDPIDATGKPTYASIGIIGDSNGGWDSDTDMVKSAFNEHIWYIESVDLVDGELKIRADDDWTNSWGADTGLSGQGNNSNDPNIKVTAGKYEIWFNDLDGRYILIPLN